MNTKTLGMIQLIVGIAATVGIILSIIEISSTGEIRDIDMLYVLFAVFAIVTAIPNLKSK